MTLLVTGSIYAIQGAAASNDDVIAGQIAYVDTPTGSGTMVTGAVNGGFPGNYATVSAGETGSDMVGIQVAATGVIEDNDAVAAQAVIVGVPVVFGGEGAVDSGYVYTEAGNSVTGAGAAEADITTTVEDQESRCNFRSICRFQCYCRRVLRSMIRISRDRPELYRR